VLVAISRENECHDCAAVHGAVSDLQKPPSGITDAIRDGRPIDDAKLEALRKLTPALARGRGRADAKVSGVLAAGYHPAQVREVHVGVMVETLSNDAHHLSATPLDAAFAAQGDAREVLRDRGSPDPRVRTPAVRYFAAFAGLNGLSLSAVSPVGTSNCSFWT
jgi:alkylhydroperoxidase family enzyme